jgi:hypothetical protein
MSTPESFAGSETSSAADLVLLDHPYAALFVPLARSEDPVVSDSPCSSQAVVTSSEEVETPLVKGLRHADEFYKQLVRGSSQKQVCFLIFEFF